jgi:hypothetical protein
VILRLSGRSNATLVQAPRFEITSKLLACIHVQEESDSLVKFVATKSTGFTSRSLQRFHA